MLHHRFSLALVTLGALLVACINHDYEPCAGKAAGAPCRVCPQNDPSCIETMEVKACDGAGTCRGTGQSSAASKVDTRNDGHAWLVDQGGGFCLSSVGVADAPTDGELWLGGARGVFRVTAHDPNATYQLDAKPIEVGGVTWLGHVAGTTYAEISGTELVAFDPGGGRRELGKGTRHPIAVSGNGCVGVKKDDDLSVIAPGSTELRPAGLPRPAGRAPVVDAAVGLEDALLVRTLLAGDGGFGALYRVACPSLAVKEIAHGTSVVNLTDLTRTESGRLFAVDRQNGDVRLYRLMQSDDDGVTWTPTPVPAGFEAHRISARGERVVVAAPKSAAILYSIDGGKTFTLDPVEAYTATDLTTSSVHVSADGVVTLGAECNYLLHRRERLP